MAARVEHPSRAVVHALCGYNRLLGAFWVEVGDNQPVVHHGPATTGRQVTLREVLGVLVKWQFFDWPDIHLAHREVQMRLADEIDDPDVRRAAEVLEAMKAEANG